MAVALPEFLAAVAGGVLEGQLELDERGRDSLDAFGETGVLPTVLTWSTIGVRVPVALRVLPKREPGQATGSAVSSPSPRSADRAELTVRLRYLMSDQGVDDPRPIVTASREEGAGWTASC